MLSNKIKHIHGKHLYYAFIAGGNQVLQNQKELNEINVFPVIDKDTGTNLASTIRTVIDNLKPSKSFDKTLNSIAEAALIGARGNSGVIFAQFFYGLSQTIPNKHSITFGEFAASLKKSIPFIYEAVADPVEGTILTVIKEWSEFLNNKRTAIHDFSTALNDSLHVLEKSLSETTIKLKELNRHGFVDAGAKGFVIFVKGIIDFINNKRGVNLNVESNDRISLIHSEHMIEEDLPYRYCTEAIIKNLRITKGEIKNHLENKGNSIVVAGSEKTCRIHIHTNDPAKLFNEVKEYGTITFQKVDDMKRQYEVVNKRKWNIAVVTDSTCDLSEELIDHYQIHFSPINLNFGENHFIDKVTIKPEQFYDMLEEANEFPTTSQINENTFTNLYSHLASHYDFIIAVHLSGQFSGTFLNSKKAAERIKEEFNKEVFVFDSRNISGGLGLLVLKIAQSIENGESFKTIMNSLEKWRENTKIYVSVRNLKYMIKGGRVSKPKGFVANLLGLNPVISLDENGKSLLFGNTFSQQSSLNKIYKHIKKTTRKKKIWNYIIMHAHNFDGAEEVKNKMTEIFNKEPASIVNISPVIGMHAGIGAVAVSLLFDDE